MPTCLVGNTYYLTILFCLKLIVRANIIEYLIEKTNGKGTHNDRKAKNHTNKDIDPTRTHLNYYIKKNELTYTKEFDKYMKENNLQGHLRSNSIIMCQMVFTSDQAFFDRIGEEETKRYFDECYKFICNYKNLGEIGRASCRERV